MKEDAMKLELGKDLLYLTENDVKRCITTEEAVHLAEEGIVADGQGKVVGNKFYMALGQDGFIKPFAGYIEGRRLGFVKTFTLFQNNPKKHKLPSTNSLVILFDAATGIPVCFMEASWVTGIKTGASSAITAKYLARKDPKVVTIFGAGLQGRTHLDSIMEIFRLEEVRIVDISRRAAEQFVKEMSKRQKAKMIIPESNEAAVKDSDIIFTVTTGNEVMVRRDWLSSGALVCKLGTYQEIDPELILQVDKFIVDNWQYASPRVPEIIHLVQSGRLSQENVYAEWPEIAGGKKSGRLNDEEIILFVGLGICGEYAAILPSVYEKALEKGLGQRLRIHQA
jgi:ornithine cyclodeaminase/alanine dehydrogenase-like protein (mu-crystallin family)